MYCSACGKELPDDANFCLKCGRPQRPDVRSDAPTYETCEIKFWDQGKPGGFFRDRTYETVYWADAIGPTGRYRAGESDPVPGSPRGGWGQPNQSHMPVWETLIAHLTGDGWESVGPGDGPWYGHRFRRRVR